MPLLAAGCWLRAFQTETETTAPQPESGFISYIGALKTTRKATTTPTPFPSTNRKNPPPAGLPSLIFVLGSRFAPYFALRLLAARWALYLFLFKPPAPSPLEPEHEREAHKHIAQNTRHEGRQSAPLSGPSTSAHDLLRLVIEDEHELRGGRFVAWTSIGWRKQQNSH